MAVLNKTPVNHSRLADVNLSHCQMTENIRALQRATSNTKKSFGGDSDKRSPGFRTTKEGELVTKENTLLIKA
jgi:hypothetical protein